jgi:TatD DNase family protein
MLNTTPPLTLADSHCHLDAVAFDPDRAEVMARARAVGVAALVVPGIDLDHCRQAVALAGAWPEVYAAVGIHPNSSDGWGTAAAAELRLLAQAPKVVAYGEIGLDFYWDKVPPDRQRAAFDEQLHLAAELGLPVIIHNRDASDDVAAILEAWVRSRSFAQSPLAARPYAGVLHAFAGDLALARRAYEWNFVLSLGGPVTFTNARSLHALVPQLQRERLMLETDAPYLTPHPYRGKRNEPAYVALVCEQLAQLYGVAPAKLAQESTALARRFCGLEAQVELAGQDADQQRWR